MNDDLLTNSLAAFESALAEPATVPVEKAAEVPMRVVKEVIRDPQTGRISRVIERSVPENPAVERAQKSAARMTTPNLFKTLREIIAAELWQRGEVMKSSSGHDPRTCPCCKWHDSDAAQPLSTTELADLDTSR
jgi:hypothetical protein